MSEPETDETVAEKPVAVPDGGTDYHEISSCATAHHYSKYDDPDQIPGDGKAAGLIEFDQFHIAHVGYECTCGERFNFGRTAAEHLRSAQAKAAQDGGRDE